MLSKSFRIATGLTALALTGCPTRDISQIDTSPAIEITRPITVKTNRQVDILFVIDNSNSMAEEQNSIANNFPKFINVLQSVQGGLPDVHIGVTSSDVGIGGTFTADQCVLFGDHGLLQNTPRGACDAPNGGMRFISDVAAPGSDGGTRVRNYPGNLADVFSCIAKLGTPGCGFEQHLEAMKEALDGTTNPIDNAGFLRDDAYLAVVILGDEDDCSAMDPSLFDPNPQLDTVNSLYGSATSYRCTEWGVSCDGINLPRAAADYTSCVPRADSPYLRVPNYYYQFLRTLKGDPNLLIGAVIAGNPTPFGVTFDSDGALALKHSCSSANGVADPAIRLKAFVDQFGSHGTFVSICQADLSDALTKIAQLLAKILSTPCLDEKVSPADIDPSQPGLQVDCQVSDVLGFGSDSESETVVPRCAMVDDATPQRTTLPCWWASIDPATCPSAISTTHLALHVERATDTVNVTEVARCSQATETP